MSKINFSIFNEYEIRRLYEQANDKNKQLRILCDCCCCTLADMCKFLEIDIKKVRYISRYKFTVRKINAMRKKGFTWNEIGRYYGVDRSVVFRWYQRNV